MRPFLALLALALTAASPASEEALRLMDGGQEAEAFSMVEGAAARGDADAIDYLAWFYDQGRFVARDQGRAAALYRRAAELGQRHAQWRLGVMLDTGEGVAENPAEALQWIKRAADQGSPLGAASLAVMYANGRGVAVDYEQARRWYLEAARRGTAAGFYGMAVLHANGQGVPRDMVEGLAWMLVAATLGDERAQREAERFGLSDAQSRAAAHRGNAILREFGLERHEIRFRNLDAEQEAVAVA